MPYLLPAFTSAPSATAFFTASAVSSFFQRALDSQSESRAWVASLFDFADISASEVESGASVREAPCTVTRNPAGWGSSSAARHPEHGRGPVSWVFHKSMLSSPLFCLLADPVRRHHGGETSGQGGGGAMVRGVCPPKTSP